MNCPACGAPMHLIAGSDSLACDFCKSVHVVEKNDDGVALLDETPEQMCPVCAIPLWSATLDGVAMHYCKHCRGMLIPMEPFVGLVETMRCLHPGSQIPSPADPAELRRKVDCPLCHHRMDAHFYYGGGSVVIDGCDACSLNWLDAGELMRVVHAPHHAEAEEAERY